ncbi:zinc finger, CCHC-type containing protein, partial [Tanacetum coccineum]
WLLLPKTQTIRLSGQFLQREKLTGPNFTNWFQNLRIVLRSEGKLVHLEQPLAPLPYPVVSQAARDAYDALLDAQNEVACLMFGSMSPELQKALENYRAYDMIQELKTMFEEQAKQELFETVKAFHACKQEEGQSVSSYLLKMKSYLDTLERLGYAMPKELGVSLILNSLNKDYDQFVQNYNMHGLGKTLAELHAMLKLYEKGIPNKAETPTMLEIQEGRIQKDKKKKKPQGAKGKGKGKSKLAYDTRPKIAPPPKREHLVKDPVCHHCKEVGHWRRNCSSYHVELKKRKNASVASTSESRKLKHGALSLYIGNGMRAGVEAIESFDLILPSGLIIGYALETAACIFNMVLTKKVDRTPYEIWHGKSPKLSYLRVWGCEALVKRDTPKKLDSRSIKCIFVDRYGYYVDIEEYELGDLDEPPNYKAALADPKSNKWLEAMNTKMQSMKDNQVWYLVDLLSNGRTNGCKWLFKKKTDMDGNVYTFKARLVAKGFTQT